MLATACASCQSQLAPAAKFCRACGAPTTAAPVAAAPTVVVEPEPASGCHACGATLTPGAAFCRACGGAATVSEVPPTLTQPAMAAAPAPPAPPEWTPPAQPAGSEGGGRSAFFVAGLVALVLLFGGGGGMAAYLLVVKKDDGSSRASSSGPAPASAAETPAAQDDASESVGDSSPTSAQGDAASDSSDASGSDAATSDDGNSSEAGDAPGSPEAVLRMHFEDIQNGEYEAAWDLLHPAYRNTAGVNWVSQREQERARIDVRSISRDGKPSGGMVRLQAEIVAADTGGEGAGICRLFSGWTRMQRSGGKWLYRPGEVNGVKPGFSANAKELDSSDPRCSSVLG